MSERADAREIEHTQGIDRPNREPAVRSGTLATNVAYLAVGVGVAKAASFVSLALMARYLGDADFGRFAFAVAAALLFEAVTDLGVGQAIAREAAGNPQRLPALSIAALPVKLFLAAVGVGFALVVAVATGAPGELVAITFYVALAHALLAVAALGRAVFEGAERMEFDALSIALEGVVRLAFVLYALLSGFGVLGIAKAYVLASLVVLVATAAIALHRFLLPLPKTVRWADGLTLVAAGLPFAAFWFLQSLTLRLDTVLLRPLAGDAATGWFAGAVRLVEPTLVIPGLFATALLPLAARHRRHGLDTGPALLVSAQKMLVLVGGALLVVVWATAPELVALALGPDFSSSVTPLQLLAVAMLALFIKQGLARLLFAAGRGRALLRGQLSTLGANLVLVAVLVPSSGAVGAALAVAASEALGVLVATLGLRDLVVRVGAFALLRPLVVIAPAAACAIAVAALPPVPRLMLVLIVFVATFVVIRPFDRSEVQYLRANAFALLSR